MQVLLPVEHHVALVRAKPEAGLSLIEVVVALLLLAIALLGLAVGFPLSRAAVYLGDRMTTAISLAQETLEAMRNRRYTATTDEITAENFPDQAPVPDFPSFRRTVDIRNNVPLAVCAPPATPCSKTVTVAVFFRDQAGQERSVQLTTILVR